MSSVQFIETQIKKISGVKNVAAISDTILQVERKGQPPFKVLVVEIPRLDRESANRLICDNPEVQVIVNPGASRHVLEDAREAGQAQNVGIYALRDFLGAVVKSPTNQLANYTASWRNWARTVLMGHQKVINVYSECEDVLVAERGLLSNVRVIPRDDYTLGVAAVTKVLRDHPNIDAILLANQYHSVSAAADIAARDAGIVAYTLKQMNKALHLDRKDFNNVGPTSN